MVGPLGFVWPWWGRGRSPRLQVGSVGAWLAPRFRVGSVWASRVPSASGGLDGGVSGHFG